MSGWTIEGLGRLPWEAVRDALHGCTCAWMDLDGLHVADPPAVMPLATHLWGWSPRRYVRVRTDVDAAYVGVLHENEGVDGPGESVQVTERTALLRALAQVDERAAQHLSTVDGLTVELLEVAGSGPVTFVRITGEAR